MMAAKSKTIYVYECWSSNQPMLMGCLFADTLRGKESCSFEYDEQWLKTHPGQYFLDPDLQRLLWYMYYIPMMGIPMLALLISMSLDRPCFSVR